MTIKLHSGNQRKRTRKTIEKSIQERLGSLKINKIDKPLDHDYEQWTKERKGTKYQYQEWQVGNYYQFQRY